MKWTVEAVARLRRGVADGESAAVIGRDLGCTRNAVVGKAHRLNIYWSDPNSAYRDKNPPPPPEPEPPPPVVDPGKDPRLCIAPGCGLTAMRQNLHRLCQRHDQERIAAKRKAA